MRDSLEGLTYEEKMELAEELAPWMAQALLKHTTILGEFSNVEAHPTAVLNNTHFNATCGKIYVGEYSFFGSNCSVITGSHDYEKKNQERIDSWKDIEGSDVIIGTGVWIGSNSLVLGPCTIGNNVVIGAGSVVVPGEYGVSTIYAGVPAKARKVIEHLVVARKQLIIPTVDEPRS
jgi:acetyltransferase-like isoleucine patch superfamily enzyme